MTYEEIKNSMNQKYEKEIINRRFEMFGTDKNEPLNGCDIIFCGCDLTLNDDFWK